MDTNSITAEQAVAYLNERRKQIQEMISCIENTVNYLSGASKAPLAVVQLMHQQPQEGPANKLKTTNRSILKPLNLFKPQGRLDEKISYILTKIGNGFKEDILAELLALQPELKIRKLDNQVAVRLSYLLKNGLINGKKIGKRFEYGFIET